MSGVRRGLLVGALVVALGALVGSVAAVAATAGHEPGAVSGSGGFGRGSAGRGYGPAMMGGSAAWPAGSRLGLPGNGNAITTMVAARARAQEFADQLGDRLYAGEVMQFSDGYYSELLSADGQGATEVLIDPDDGAVNIEYGPAMMWNTGYGMHRAENVAARVSAEQAVIDAQAWLDAQHTGMTAGEATAFPGYYTLHTLRDGSIVGMMSVNALTGAAWYHTWHGTFIAMIGE